jgi:hypothetical protein
MGAAVGEERVRRPWVLNFGWKSMSEEDVDRAVRARRRRATRAKTTGGIERRQPATSSE